MNATNAKSAVGVLLQVTHAIYEACAAKPEGLPAGTVYALLMAQGCTLAQYEQIEALMLRSGVITKKGDLLFAAVRS